MTRWLGVAAIGLAVVALFGDGAPTLLTVLCAVAGLVPWALVEGGVRLAPSLFAVLAGVPAVVMVVVDGNAGGMFPLMLLIVWVVCVADGWPIVAAVVVVAFAAITVLAVREGPGDSGLIYFYGGTGISLLAGVLLRRQLALTAQVRAMRDVEVQRLAAEERTRIAREVHDVVAHSLTVVMLNLTGARRALATQPERADEALERAERVGRESLDSIRQVMGLLRGAADGSAVSGSTLGGIPRLVDAYRSAGLDVTLTVDGVAALDDTVELVVYRVVQESLANVLQHAPGAGAKVVLTGTDREVTFAIENGPPTRQPEPSERTGLGTRGMAERVAAVGGRFHAGPTVTGGWRVEAIVPRHGHGDAEAPWLAPRTTAR